MIFQKKIDGMLKKLHEDKLNAEEENFKMPELEKNDFLAMVIAAMITIVPVALLVLGGICLVGYFFFFH